MPVASKGWELRERERKKSPSAELYNTIWPLISADTKAVICGCSSLQSSVDLNCDSVVYAFKYLEQKSISGSATYRLPN